MFCICHILQLDRIPILNISCFTAFLQLPFLTGMIFLFFVHDLYHSCPTWVIIPQFSCCQSQTQSVDSVVLFARYCVDRSCSCLLYTSSLHHCHTILAQLAACTEVHLVLFHKLQILSFSLKKKSGQNRLGDMYQNHIYSNHNPALKYR